MVMMVTMTQVMMVMVTMVMMMMVTMMQVILGSSTWRLRWRWGADIPLTCILIGQYFITVIICMIHIFV